MSAQFGAVAIRLEFQFEARVLGNLRHLGDACDRDFIFLQGCEGEGDSFVTCVQLIFGYDGEVAHRMFRIPQAVAHLGIAEGQHLGGIDVSRQRESVE
jgi:hypothetical protein